MEPIDLFEITHNMRMKSLPSVARTWQPVTWFACAIQAPERPGRLSWCYVGGKRLGPRIGAEEF
jgi:hypothetical protein